MQEIAIFSYDENHTYRPDNSSLQYYYTPRLGQSLSRGYEKFRKFDDSGDEHLDGLLRCLGELEQRELKRLTRHSNIDASSMRKTGDVCCWRGIGTKVRDIA